MSRRRLALVLSSTCSAAPPPLHRRRPTRGDRSCSTAALSLFATKKLAGRADGLKRRTLGPHAILHVSPKVIVQLLRDANDGEGVISGVTIPMRLAAAARAGARRGRVCAPGPGPAPASPLTAAGPESSTGVSTAGRTGHGSRREATRKLRGAGERDARSWTRGRGCVTGGAVTGCVRMSGPALGGAPRRRESSAACDAILVLRRSAARVVLLSFE